MPQGLGSSNGQSRARLSGAAPGQPALSPLGVQFFSSLEGLEIASSTDRQLIRGHNLIGAVRLQFVKASFFDGGAGEHGEVLDEIDGIDVPLSMHVYPFPQADEWENQWFFFDIQLHPYQLHFRRRVEDGEESIIGGWEDSYAKLAQVRGQMCVQAYVDALFESTNVAETQAHNISIRPLRLANDCLPTIAPRATFHGPVDTTAFRFKAGSLSNNQLKCCGFIQCSTYLVPPRDKDPTFRGGQMFHILAYMPHDQQPWKSRRGSIVGVLNPALLQEELQPGQDILVVLVDEFSFTSKATLEGATVMRKASSPQKAKVDLAKRRNPFSSSPDNSPPKRAKDPSSTRGMNGTGKEIRDGAYMPVDLRLQQELAGHERDSILVADFTESEPMRQDTFAPPAEREGQLMKLPPEGTTYSSFHEMRQELVEFARSQSYGIRICRSFQKFSRITGDPVAKKRMVWQCNRGGKGDCPFSFNAVEVKIGSDRWEIRYKKNESQHVHNHGPSGGFVICPERKVRK
ncbi:hypothetical protein FOFC_20756 [Fusarium oxysporum]|nr:hypothetical protein FOFC_20756 [Fusarium oxysporum]